MSMPQYVAHFVHFHIWTGIEIKTKVTTACGKYENAVKHTINQKALQYKYLFKYSTTASGRHSKHQTGQ